jgi:hypothetical protein
MKMFDGKGKGPRPTSPTLKRGKSLTQMLEDARNEALEEAAKVADRYEIPMCETSASHIAAAIRGMVKD